MPRIYGIFDTNRNFYGYISVTYRTDMSKSDKPALEALSDSALLEEYRKRGELEVIGELYKRYLHLVFGVCLKYLKDRDEASDATMQIFEKIITDLKKHNVTSLPGWLHVLARNHCLMALRKQRKNASEIDEAAIVEFPQSAHPLNEKQERETQLELLEYCIEKLKGEQQECIRLFYLEERSYREIASQNGLDIKKVKSHIQNGRRNLKICMEESSDESR